MKTRSLSPFARLLDRPRRGDGRQTQQDRALARRLFMTFEDRSSNVRINGVHFYVLGGTVTLYGTVVEESDRAAIATLVQAVPGVQDVVIHLQVVTPQREAAARP